MCRKSDCPRCTCFKRAPLSLEGFSAASVTLNVEHRQDPANPSRPETKPTRYGESGELGEGRGTGRPAALVIT